MVSHYSLDRNFTTNPFKDEIGIDQVPNVILQAKVGSEHTFLTFKLVPRSAFLWLAGFNPITVTKIFEMRVSCGARIIGTVNNLNLNPSAGQSVSSGSTFVVLESGSVVSFMRLSPRGTATYVGH